MAKGRNKTTAKKLAAKRLAVPLPSDLAQLFARVGPPKPVGRTGHSTITRYLALQDLGARSQRAQAEDAAPVSEKAAPKDPKVWLTKVPTRFPTGPEERRPHYFKRLETYMRKELGDNAWTASTIEKRLYEYGLLQLRQKHPKKSH